MRVFREHLVRCQHVCECVCCATESAEYASRGKRTQLGSECGIYLDDAEYSIISSGCSPTISRSKSEHKTTAECIFSFASSGFYDVGGDDNVIM